MLVFLHAHSLEFFNLTPKKQLVTRYINTGTNRDTMKSTRNNSSPGQWVSTIYKHTHTGCLIHRDYSKLIEQQDNRGIPLQNSEPPPPTLKSVTVLQICAFSLGPLPLNNAVNYSTTITCSNLAPKPSLRANIHSGLVSRHTPCMSLWYAQTLRMGLTSLTAVA